MSRWGLLIFIGWMLVAGAPHAGAALPQLVPSLSQNADDGQMPQLPPDATDAQIDAVLARMSDDQVRRLLLEELKKDAAEKGTGASMDRSFAEVVRGMDGQTEHFFVRFGQVLASCRHLPRDLAAVIDTLTEKRGGAHIIGFLLISAAIFWMAYGIEGVFKKKLAGTVFHLEAIPEMGGLLKFWSVLLRFFMDIVGLILFTLSAYGIYLLIDATFYHMGAVFFIAYLGALLIVRIYKLLSRLVLSPLTVRLRLVPIACSSAIYLHKRMTIAVAFATFSFVTCMLLAHLGMATDSSILLLILIMTACVLFFAAMIISNRQRVSQTIVSKEVRESEGMSWLKAQFAVQWHVLACAYLFVIWILWVRRILVVGLAHDGAFVISLLIVPIYLALDRVAQWLMQTTIHTLKGAVDKETDSNPESADTPQDPAGDADSVADDMALDPTYNRIARRVSRCMILMVLSFWLMNIWNIPIPFADVVMRSALDIFVTLLLAHLVWRSAIGLINRKLKEGEPPPSEETQESDEAGWGAVVKSRSQTILPLVRKFIGTVLVVMVTMILLSSIGVDIGPLLAGAGVVGLAIGFGAQKLVSDVLSGIFFLIDDTFRVGEFIEAGEITGSVEEITLRTVKLRHYRGMLQFVPFGQLGTITNFMRGNMITKFNIQLPYGTNIDKVRKIIKKTGLKMMEDPELQKDIIQPPKSQGVRRAEDSVLQFRIKFTAKPGRHFIVRREAFRRITEALEAAGYSYAHRRVIVDVPEALKGENNLQTAEQSAALQSGAAAALDTIAKEELEKQAPSQKD